MMSVEKLSIFVLFMLFKFIILFQVVELARASPNYEKPKATIDHV